MKRSFLFRRRMLVAGGLGLIAATYGLVRLAYGLFLPDVQHDLGLATDAAGWVSSGASVLYCVGALGGFLLAARAPRVLVLAATVIAGAGALGMASAPSSIVFATASVLGSTAAGLASPALVRLVARQVPDALQSRAQSVVNAGTGPGLVGAGVLALVLLPDWRTAWAVSGVFALVAGGVVLVASRSGTPPGPGPDHTAHDDHDHRRGGPARPDRPDRAWFVAHRLVVTVAVLFGAGSAVVWTYGRSALLDAGAPDAVSVTAWIALGLGGAAVVVTTRWTGGLGPRTLWAVTTGAVALSVLVIGTMPGSAMTALLACVVFGWGYTAATGALITWTAEIDADRASAGTSALFVALVVGQAVGSAGAGVVVQAGGNPTAFVAGALVTAGSAAAVVRRRRGPVTAAGAARSSGCTPPTPPPPRAGRSRHPAGP